MPQKTKANVDYVSSGTGAPILGDCMIWNGSEFVPDSTFTAYTVLTVGSTVIWNVTLLKKIKISTTINFTLIISNLFNGSSGTLILVVTSGTSTISLSTEVTNYGAGRIDGLTAGRYIFCYEYDGSNLYWNMAKYT